MQIDDIRQRLRELGARPIHEQAILKAWTRGWPLDQCHRDPATFFPASLRAALPALTYRSC